MGALNPYAGGARDVQISSMEFCEAVAVSATTGRAVDLPLVQPAMDAWGAPLKAP